MDGAVDGLFYTTRKTERFTLETVKYGVQQNVHYCPQKTAGSHISHGRSIVRSAPHRATTRCTASLHLVKAPRRYLMAPMMNTTRLFIEQLDKESTPPTVFHTRYCSPKSPLATIRQNGARRQGQAQSDRFFIMS